MSILLIKFLLRNNYTQFNKKDVSLQLQTHPNNPSFRAMTDTLDYFEIENVAANVPEEALDVLPKDFLTTINLQDQELVLATKKSGSIVTQNEDGQKTKYSLMDFKEIWSKNIIAIEKPYERNNIMNLQKYGFVVPLGLLVGFIFVGEPSILQISKIILAASGLFISYLLVKEKIGFHSSTVLNVCTALPNSNCNDVINSKAGNITKDFSLADASFLYFIILLFQILFFDNNLVVTTLLFLSLPIIFLSIYYQGIILKKWCLLCLGIVLVLGLLNLTLLLAYSTEISFISLLKFLLILSMTIPSYFYIKTLIKTTKKDKQEIIESRRFKRDSEMVKKIMEDAKIVNDIIAIDDEIIIGNSSAGQQLIVLTNPFCGFCKNAFMSYVKIIEVNPDIKISIRFLTQVDDLESPSTQVSCRLIEIYHKNGKEEFINSYISWFKDKDNKGWLKKYKNPKFEKSSISLLNHHKKWAEKNEILYTPATIINRKILPGIYGYDDLVFVVNDIFGCQSDNAVS